MSHLDYICGALILWLLGIALGWALCMIYYVKRT